MPTIHDVARLAGVSPTTAKRAVREPERLAVETLERVQRAIAALHYEPHQIASALRGGHNRVVGLMVGDILEPTFAMLTRIIGKAVRERGYSLLLADSEYNPKLELQNLKLFYGNRVSGVILRSAYLPSNYDYLTRLQERGTAVVEIDYIQRDSPFSHVMLSNEEAVLEGISYLYALGHRRVAYLGVAALEERPEERYTGFVKAMRRYALPVVGSYLTPLAQYGEEEAYRVARLLLALPEPPSAIFAFNGTCTLSAFRAIRDGGLQIPQDISLLGFDNYTWTGLVDPPLDVIEQPLEAMGVAAVETLMKTIAGGPDAQVVRTRFPGRLIRRGSAAPPRRA